MNNTGVTGLTAPKDFEHARGPRNSAYAVNLTYDRHTTYDIPTTYIYISREISIEHPSVGLASLAQIPMPFQTVVGSSLHSNWSSYGLA